MKRVFPLRSNALALVLAASIAIAGPGYGHADTTTSWNPITWFSGPSDEANMEKARKKVEAAQHAADQALKEAQKALEKASEARKQAEALQSTPQKQTVTEPPQQTETKSTLSTQESQTDKAADSLRDAETLEPIQEVQSFHQETTHRDETVSAPTSKTEPWNPLSWFKKEETSQTPPVEAETSTQQTQTQEPESPIKLQSPPEAQATKASEQQHESAEQEAKAATQPIKSANQSTETETSSEQSKGSIWNPVSWFAKPATTSAPEVATTQKPETPQAKTAAVTPVVKAQAAMIETEKGKIAIELYPDQAPITVANFVKLVNEGFYNRFNMKFHRVVPGFVIQTGDPTGTGAGGSKERIPLEAKNKLSHNAKGIVAMARGADPNSASSQFYITLTSQTTLDGKYAIFGRVISGLDVLDKIEKDDMLYGIRLVDLSTITRDPETEKKKFFSSMF